MAQRWAAEQRNDHAGVINRGRQWRVDHCRHVFTAVGGLRDTSGPPAAQDQQARLRHTSDNGGDGGTMQPGESAGQQSQRRRSEAASLRAQAQVLNEKADRVERAAELWERGLVGEQTVGAQLERLRVHGFDVFHDVHWPGRQRANIDHVAVGPPGILVVDAKNWSGNVTIRDGVLQQNGYQRDRELSGASQAGRDVGALLNLPWALHVIPVIALATPSFSGIQRCRDVTVVGHGDLVGWATSLPAQLTPGDVLGISVHLRAAMPSATTPLLRRSRRSARRSAHQRAPREESARQRQRAARREAARREALLKIIGLVALLALGPTLVSWWASHGEGVVRAAVPTPTFSALVPTPTPTAAVAAFPGCSALRRTYPYGVQLPGAVNRGTRSRGLVVTDSSAYRANSGLDADHDGIACEVIQHVSRH